MKIKLFRILKARKILSELGERKDFDGLTSLQISRNIDKIEPEGIKFDKANNDLIIKLGEKKEVEIEGKKEEGYQVPPAKMDEYFKQLNEMTEIEIELDILLLDPARISGFSPMELLAIEWLFK